MKSLKLMIIIICPGIHEPKLTESFCQNVELLSQLNRSEKCLIFPTQDYPAYSGVAIKDFLNQMYHQDQDNSVLFIAFSAGVVGAIEAANRWHNQGGKVKAFIGIDGWGVPLIGNFPIHRLSHDYFTHWSSGLLGGGLESFYAQPAVAHLQIWKSPQNTFGYWVRAPGCLIYCRASEFITLLVEKYQEMS